MRSMVDKESFQNLQDLAVKSARSLCHSPSLYQSTDKKPIQAPPHLLWKGELKPALKFLFSSLKYLLINARYPCCTPQWFCLMRRSLPLLYLQEPSLTKPSHPHSHLTSALLSLYNPLHQGVP